MNYELAKVKFWNLQFDEPIRDTNADRGRIPEAVLEKRAAFVLEESEEIIDAMMVGDHIEILDGLADLGFVSAGTVLECGLELKQETYISVAGKLLTSGCERLAEGLKNRDWPYVEHVLIELEYIYRGIGAVYGLPYMAAFEEVFNSNMSKKENGKVTRNEFGKIMKPSSFRKPDIQGVLARNGWDAGDINI